MRVRGIVVRSWRERRAVSVQRFDNLHSPRCDEQWGAIGATRADPRQVPGEVVEDVSYHYCPARPQVREWLDAAGSAVSDRPSRQ